MSGGYDASVTTHDLHGGRALDVPLDPTAAARVPDIGVSGGHRLSTVTQLSHTFNRGMSLISLILVPAAVLLLKSIRFTIQFN